jgi:integrase
MSPANLSLNAQSWGSEPSDNITIADANINNGREDGNNPRPGYENEPQNLDGEDIPLGTGEQSAESLPVSLSIDADAKMNLTEVEKRFFDATRIGLKASSQRYYFDRFRKMIRVVHLGDYSKRQLAGPIGKRLILDYISTVSKPSVRTQLAAIKRVWMNGIGLPWPIDAKMDIGKLPKVERESTPPNQPVQEWAKSLSIEKDPYLKLVWLFMAQHGWRPSHATGVRWSDVRYDDLGHPCAIRTTGARAEFKTYAPVAVSLAPDVIQALEEWRKIHPNPNGNAWILPHRGLTGKLDVNRRMKTRHFEKLWQCVQEKYGLPKLRPKDLRHWVSTACRKAGLSKPASNYLRDTRLT